MKEQKIMSEDRVKYNKQWRQKLSDLGWKNYATIAPPSIVKKIKDYRNQLMKEWWDERSKETEN